MDGRKIIPLTLWLVFIVSLHTAQRTEAISMTHLLDLLKSPEVERHLEFAILHNPLVRKELIGILRGSLPAIERIIKLLNLPMQPTGMIPRPNSFGFGEGAPLGGALGGAFGGGSLVRQPAAPLLGGLLH